MADLDGDGDLDVLGASSAASEIAWWENGGAASAAGGSWTEHNVASGFLTAVGVAAADLDADGDLDVFGAFASSPTAGRFAWWENDGSACAPGCPWPEHEVADADGAHGVALADLDADGDLDLLGAAEIAGTIGFWDNRGGQSALPTADAVLTPAPIEGAEEVSLLRILRVTHRTSASSTGEMSATDLPLALEYQADVASSFLTVLPLWTLSVTVDGAGSGNVTSMPGAIDCGSLGAICADEFADGTEVTLTPVADAGSTFGGWSGDADCADGVVDMTADVACTATFDVATHVLDATVVGTGNVQSAPPGIDCGNGPADCSEPYDLGATVTLTATPAPDWLFDGWSGDPDCGDGEVTMSAAVACTATFVTIEIFADGFESGDTSAWSSAVDE